MKWASGCSFSQPTSSTTAELANWVETRPPGLSSLLIITSTDALLLLTQSPNTNSNYLRVNVFYLFNLNKKTQNHVQIKSAHIVLSDFVQQRQIIFCRREETKITLSSFKENYSVKMKMQTNSKIITMWFNAFPAASVFSLQNHMQSVYVLLYYYWQSIFSYFKCGWFFFLNQYFITLPQGMNKVFF